MLKRGELEFQSDISKAQEYILSEYEEELKMENYRLKIDRSEYQDKINKIVYFSKDKLLSNLNNLLG